MFCMPHMAADDYVRNFTIYVRDHLDKALKPHIELSNEVWNYGFVQTTYANTQGIAMGFHDGIADANIAGQRWYGYRSAQIFIIWEQVFGGAKRLVRIIASQVCFCLSFFS